MATFKHLISINDLSDLEVVQLCTRALKGPPEMKAIDPSKKAVALIFTEASTRTRVSFERATQLLGRNYVFIGANGSSLEKDESLEDTLLNLSMYGVNTFVVRNGQTGSLESCRDLGVGSLINAGDGTGEHPTQLLTDLTILLEAYGGDLRALKGLKLGILGDLSRSRVAGSWSRAARRFGIEVNLISPAAWRPTDWGHDLPWSDDLRSVLPKLDVVMALRVQKERMLESEKGSIGDFLKQYQLSAKDLGPQQWLMHPGPVNWGIELNADLQRHPRSLILHQARAGLAVRAALLEMLG